MKHYSLQKKSYINVISDNFSETLKSFGGFAGCLAGAGIFNGIFRNIEACRNSFNNGELNLISGIFIVGSIFYVKEIYKNFRKERERVHQLVREMNDERKKPPAQIEGLITPDQLSRLQFQKILDRDEKIVELQNYQDILNGSSSTQSNINGATQGKRRSLNNGIFKSNDTY